VTDASTWQYLDSQASGASSSLWLDPAVRDTCSKACDALISELQGAAQDLGNLDLSFNLGDFNCPVPLIKAIQDTVLGDDGFRGRLLQHIEIVNEIKATILGQVRQLQEQDEANAANTPMPDIVAPPTPQQATGTVFTQQDLDSAVNQMQLNIVVSPQEYGY
jgi:hypothetical protein